MKSFRNKVVVVTGGASGIGLALCHEFAADGAKLALFDLDPAAIEEATQQLAVHGVDVLGVPCDVASEEACLEAAERVRQRFGGADVLINNAGITQREAFENTDVAVIRKVMDVNFFGSVHCTKALLDSLVARRGLIIAIESVAGIAPLLGRAGYCASKHAMHGFFTTLRTELRSRGAHMLIVCPGFVKTNLQARALAGDGRVTSHPQSTVGKELSPEQVAEEIHAAALERRHLLVLTLAGKLGYWVSRVAPVLYERIIERQFKAELDRS